jgi:hypothetical protein
MNRRGFLSSIIAMAAAPAIVKASSLMPGRVWTPETKIYGGLGFIDARPVNGWAEWAGSFSGWNKLATPSESFALIDKWNSFDDKPHALVLPERYAQESLKGDSILLTPSTARHNDWANTNVVKDKYVPVGMQGISGEHWSHDGIVKVKMTVFGGKK